MTLCSRVYFQVVVLYYVVHFVCFFYFFFFFFFQAEDGIRDDLVTGVQTCALPISGVCHAVVVRRLWPSGAGSHVLWLCGDYFERRVTAGSGGRWSTNHPSCLWRREGGGGGPAPL